MPTLKDQQRLAEYGLLKSDQTLGIFSMLKRMEEELRKEIIGKIEKEFSANAINERMVKNILKDIKGEKGDNPTKEELLDLIKDVFESIRPSLKGERGETPTERELRLLVEKSIDKIKHQLKGEKGNPPDKREIEQIVRSVFEDLSPSLKGEKGDFIKGEPGIPGPKGDDGSPDTPEQVRDKLIKLIGEDRLPASAIKDLDKIAERVVLMGGDRGRRNYLKNNVVPTGTINGTNTEFTLPSQAKLDSEKVFVNGQRMRKGSANDYTMNNANTKITFNTAPPTGSNIIVDLEEDR